MVMGSPLYGTIFATLAVNPETLNLPNHVDVTVIAFGAIIWIVVHSTAALLFFLATLASFDGCLGECPKSSRPPAPFPGKEGRDRNDVDRLMTGLARHRSKSLDQLDN